MKKKLLMVGLALCTVALLFGCGKDDKEGKAKEYVKVGKYKGLEIEKVDPIKVTDEDVEGAIRTELQSLEMGKEVQGPAEFGDNATMDFVGKINGEAFQGGTAENEELTLGSGKFIPGFEEQIVGHSVGEVFDINVTFPKDYQAAEMAGQKAVFTITLKKIIRLPELTEELLPKLGTEAKTVKEYKKEIKKGLEELNAEQAQSQNQSLILEELSKICEMKKYPTSRLIRVTKDYVFVESFGANQQQMGIDEASQAMYGKSVEEQVKETIALEMALEYIADKEGIKISDKEYREWATEQALRLLESSEVDAFIQTYESIYGEGSLKRAMLREKVAAFLLKNSKAPKEK